MQQHNTKKRGRKRNAIDLLSTQDHDDTTNPRPSKTQRTTNGPNDNYHKNATKTHNAKHNIASIESSDDSDEGYEQHNYESDHISLPHKPKDDKCPKKPLNAYSLYAIQRCHSIRQKFPNKPNTEIAKEIGKEWKTLSKDEKKTYEDKASKLKEKYYKKLEEYEECERRKQAATAEKPRMRNRQTSYINTNVQPTYLHTQSQPQPQPTYPPQPQPIYIQQQPQPIHIQQQPQQFAHNYQSHLYQNPRQYPQQNQTITVNSYSDQNNISKNKCLDYGFWIITFIIIVSMDCWKAIIYYHLSISSLLSVSNDYCHDNAEIITAIVFITFGPMLLLYGKRLIPNFVFICGFVSTYLFVYKSGYFLVNNPSTMERTVTAAACGVVVGFIATGIYYRIQLLFSTGCGSCISYFLWLVYVEPYIISNYNLKDDTMGIVAIIFNFCVTAFITGILLNTMDIIITISVGAFMTTNASQYFIAKYIPDDAAHNSYAIVPIGASIQSELYDMSKESKCIFIVLFAIGFIYQFGLYTQFTQSKKETQAYNAPQQIYYNNDRGVSREKKSNYSMCLVLCVVAIGIFWSLGISDSMPIFNTSTFQSNQYDFKNKNGVWFIYESFKEIGYITGEKNSKAVVFVETEPHNQHFSALIKKDKSRHVVANGTHIGSFEPKTYDCGYVSCKHYLEFVPSNSAHGQYKYLTFVSIKTSYAEYTEFKFYQDISLVTPLAKARIHGQEKGLGKAMTARLNVFSGARGPSKKEFIRIVISLISRNLYTYEESRSYRSMAQGVSGIAFAKKLAHELHSIYANL
eukprot:441862_1